MIFSDISSREQVDVTDMHSQTDGEKLQNIILQICAALPKYI